MKQIGKARRSIHPRRSITTVGGLVLTLSLLVACGSTDDGRERSATPQVNQEDTTAKPFATWNRAPNAEGGSMAANGGQLMIEDGCLYLGESADRTLLVMPDDATWNEETNTIELDGYTASIGDDVNVGGGEIGNESKSDIISYAPPGCDDSNAWKVIAMY